MAGKKTVEILSKKSLNNNFPFLITLKAIPERQTKSQILIAIAKETTLPKETINSVFEALAKHIVRHMKKHGSGEFTIPEAGIRIKRKTRPATKKKMGRNPATGKQMIIAAKPSRTVVKIIPLRALKESLIL